MGSRGMRGGEGSLGQVREPVPAPLRGRSRGRRGGRCGVRGLSGVRCSCERGPPPRSGTEGQLVSEGSFFLPVLSPCRSISSPRGVGRAGIPRESREVAGCGGSAVRGCRTPSRTLGQRAGSAFAIPRSGASEKKSRRNPQTRCGCGIPPAATPRPSPPCRGSPGCAALGSLGRCRPAAASAHRSR